MDKRNKTGDKLMAQYYRHGDVLFRPARVPVKAKKIATHNYIVAYGEHTGHKHVLTGAKFVAFEYNGKRFIEVTEPTELVHEEHKTLTLEPGQYEIAHEREYDYFSHEIQKVQD